MKHIIVISTRVSIEYINIGDIEELAMIGAVTGKDTASAPPTEIIWDEGLKVERVPSGSSCDESFIGGGGVSTSLFFFDANWSLRDLFSSINFNRPKTEYLFPVCTYYLMTLSLFPYILF